MQLRKLFSRHTGTSATSDSAGSFSEHGASAVAPGSLEAIRAKASRGEFAAALHESDDVLSTHGPRGDSMFTRAYVLFEWGRHREALTWSLRAHAAGYDAPELLRQIAWCQFYGGDAVQAQATMRDAFAGDSTERAGHFALGALLQAVGHADEAASLLAAGLEGGDDADALDLLGGIRLDNRQYAEAEQLFRRATAVDPRRVASWNNLGVALSRQERRDEGLAAFQRALDLDSARRQSDSFVNLAIELRQQGRESEATALYRLHLPATASSTAFFNFALARLADGALREGWHYYDFRWLRPPLVTLRPSYQKPCWDGQALERRTILIRSEQGIGDVVQCLRYARLLEALGARVLLRPLPGVEAIARTVPGIHRVLRPDEDEPFDFYVHAMTLPRVFGTEVETVPQLGPYVFAERDRLDRWRDAVAGDGLKVAIVWAGSPDHQLDRYRSVPVDVLGPLFAMQGVRFFSLQKGRPESEMSRLPNTVAELGTGIRDFGDTAAILAHVDLAICVDTSVAHLAGAMGRDVWMLNARPGDWRWWGEQETTPWYPTMRIFRQAERNQWEGVIADVARALAARRDGDGAKTRMPAGVDAMSADDIALRYPPLSPERQAEGFSPVSAVVETRFGVVQYRPRGGPRDIALRWYGEYLSEHLRVIGPLVPAGGVVVEGGAQEGLHALALSAKVGVQGDVIACEDDPILRGMLRANVVANAARNITVMPGGLNLDEMRLERLDLLKTAGDDALRSALASGVQTLWRTRPAVLAADLSRTAIDAAAPALRDAGYRCWYWRTPIHERDDFNRREQDITQGAWSEAIVALPEEAALTIDVSGMEALER